MSAAEEYAKWSAKHYKASYGFELADATISELEAERDALRRYIRRLHAATGWQETADLIARWMREGYSD